jgi:hypothetical protein
MIQRSIFPEGDSAVLHFWNAKVPDPQTGKLRLVKFIIEMRMELMPENVDAAGLPIQPPIAERLTQQERIAGA